MDFVFTRYAPVWVRPSTGNCAVAFGMYLQQKGLLRRRRAGDETAYASPRLWSTTRTRECFPTRTAGAAAFSQKRRQLLEERDAARAGRLPRPARLNRDATELAGRPSTRPVAPKRVRRGLSASSPHGACPHNASAPPWPTSDTTFSRGRRPPPAPSTARSPSRPSSHIDHSFFRVARPGCPG